MNKKMSLKQEFRGKELSPLFPETITIVGKGKTKVVETDDPIFKGEEWEFYITSDKKHYPKSFVDECYI